MRNILILLTIILLCACKSPPHSKHAEKAPDIVILNPEFEIVSIFILQADLVVTQFETVLKITNPNEFALELNSLTYELFGNGLSWARGSGKNILHIPANGTTAAKFLFEMNFINMNRRLLDDVIAMRRVNYRFKGAAEVQPVISNIASFHMNYDCSGYSDVKRN